MYCLSKDQVELQTSWILKFNIIYCTLLSCVTFVGTFFGVRYMRRHPIFHDATQMLLYLALVFCNIHDLAHIGIQWSALYKVIYYADDSCSLFFAFSECVYLSRTLFLSICVLIFFQSALTINGLIATFFPNVYHNHRKTPGFIMCFIVVLMSLATNFIVITLEDQETPLYSPSCQFFPASAGARANIYLISSIFILVINFLINVGLYLSNKCERAQIYDISKKYQNLETKYTSKAISLLSLVQLSSLCVYSGGTYIFRTFKDDIPVAYYHNIVIWVYALSYVTASLPLLIIYCIRYVRSHRRRKIKTITNHQETLEFRMGELKNMWSVFSQLAQCSNSGTPLNSTNCLCPGYTSGKLCEVVKCQRWGIPDQGRCSCPPGWYDKYCGIRGCRPVNEDNMNLEKRSFIIVFNTKTSMKSQLEGLKSAWPWLINSIMTNQNSGVAEYWIENFIFYGFVQGQGALTIVERVFTKSQDVLDFLNTLQLTDGDAEQPVLTALKNAQQSIPSMRSHAIVLVFTDSPASDAPALSHRFIDNNIEQHCLQISSLWRSKVSFILNLPDNADFSKDSVDVYRRLASSTHGDLFQIRNAADLENVLKHVIAFYYFPENVHVGYGINGSVTLPTYKDNAGDYVFVLITQDQWGMGDVPVVGDAISWSIGTTFSLYNMMNVNLIKIAPKVYTNYNYRVFIQSKKTVMFAYNDDMNIDFGNSIVVKNISMTSTIRTFGFDNIINNTYQVNDLQNNLLRESYSAKLRPQTDCTVDYYFEAWENTYLCPSGPITQVHNFYLSNVTHQRVTPAYCIDAAHFYPQATNKAKTFFKNTLPYPPKTELNYDLNRDEDTITPLITCDSKNYKVVNDPRLTTSNQFIFILEQHLNNSATYQQLVLDIENIVNLVDTDKNLRKKEFTLIIHDDKVSRVLISTYSPTNFVTFFKTAVQNLPYVANLDNTLGLHSIVQAQKIVLQPTAQIFYFTNQAVKNVQNISRPWDIVDRNVEVNFFTIADGVTTEIFALPKELELVQKMSNGRIIPLGGILGSLYGIFADMVFETALTTDHEKYNCHDLIFNVDAYMERDATNAVVQVVGTGITTIRMFTPDGMIFDHTKYVTYTNGNFASINIDLTKEQKGLWHIGAQTTRGGCQITVRHKTTTGVIMGFANSSFVDVADSQIPLQRTNEANQTLTLPIRVTNQLLTFTANLQIELVNRQRYDMPVFFTNTTVMLRDDVSCAFNLMSARIQVPKQDLTLWTLTGYATNGDVVLRRVFYYYQHIPADSSICNGGQVDALGNCVCSEGHTGEYCWDRFCVNGATLNNHICNCVPGFYGDFCEKELLVPNWNSSTTSSTTSTIQTTTSLTSRISISNSIILLVISLIFLL